MWKKTKHFKPDNEPMDVKQHTNNILLDTLTLHLQIQDFKGKRGDEEFSQIQEKLMDNMLKLKKIEQLSTEDALTKAIKQVETTVKNSLSKLERKAAENDNFKVTRYTTTKRVSKAEKTIYQVKKEIFHLNQKLDNFEVFQAGALEKKIVSLSEELEGLELNQSTELHATRKELLKMLVKCSGKLKKAQRRGSAPSQVIVKGLLVLNEDSKLRRLQAEVQALENDLESYQSKIEAIEAIRELLNQCVDQQNASERSETKSEYDTLIYKLNSMLNTYTCKSELIRVPGMAKRQLSTFDFGDINVVTQEDAVDSGCDTSVSSQECQKMRLDAFKLCWGDLSDCLYSERVETDLLQEIVDELEGVSKDILINLKQLKKYIRQKREQKEEGAIYDSYRIKMRAIISDLQSLKGDVICFNGIYQDENFREIKDKLEDCIRKLDGLECGDLKNELGKTKVKKKVFEYLELLDEKSIKV